MRGKAKSSKIKPGDGSVPLAMRRAPPRFGPGAMDGRPNVMRRRPMPRQMVRRPVRRIVGEKDKEMDETLKKLKKMSE